MYERLKKKEEDVMMKKRGYIIFKLNMITIYGGNFSISLFFQFNAEVTHMLESRFIRLTHITYCIYYLPKSLDSHDSWNYRNKTFSTVLSR